jgi:hypothetical protein
MIKPPRNPQGDLIVSFKISNPKIIVFHDEMPNSLKEKTISICLNAIQALNDVKSISKNIDETLEKLYNINWNTVISSAKIKFTAKYISGTFLVFYLKT